MIYKIAVWFLLPMAVLALFLSFSGVQQVEFGSDYHNFLRNVASSFNTWRIQIPKIPNIPYLDDVDFDSTGLILGVLIKIANAWFFLVNALVSLLNITITVMNVVIQVIQFILTVLYQCKDFITGFSNSVVIAYV